METNYQTNDVLDPHIPKKLPDSLNVLTILTFIGCGLSYIIAIFTFFVTSNISEKVDKMTQAGTSQETIDMFVKSAENRNVLLISGLLFTTLCLIGALQMRKFKRTGYYLYVIGELAPLVVSFGLLGSLSQGPSGSLKSILGMVFGIGIPVLWVILYSVQLKHLDNK